MWLGTAKRLAVATALGFLILVGGCGGGDDDGGNTATQSSDEATRFAPEPAESVEQFGSRLTAAIQAARSGNCSPIEEINSLSRRPFSCADLKTDQWNDFEVTGTAEFGTGGVVDYTDTEVPAGGMVLIGLDLSGKYGVIFAGNAGGKTVGTQPVGVEAQDATVQRLLDAIRNEDCDEFFATALTERDKSVECKEVFSSDLHSALTKDTAAKAERFGGTAKTGFYGLSTTGGGYRTIITLPGSSDSPDDWVVDTYSATG